MFKKILCLIFNHEYQVYKKAVGAKGIRWLICSRCNRSFVINDSY